MDVCQSLAPFQALNYLSGIVATRVVVKSLSSRPTTLSPFLNLRFLPSHVSVFATFLSAFALMEAYIAWGNQAWT